MDNKKYIKVITNDYGYMIDVVNRDNKHKLSKQDTIIMRKVLNNFKCIRKSENVFIFYDYDLIIQKFYQEKKDYIPKKVNRKKSNQIIAGFLIAATVIVSAYAISNADKKDKSQTNNDFSFKDNTSYADSGITHANNDLENINEFCYEFDKPNDKQALMNSEKYMKLFYKYEKIYGVDAKLLCAIGAQENSGIHRSSSKNGKFYNGLMGIEYIWDNGEIRVFNFEKNKYETIVVDYSRIEELEYNIKIGAAIFQNYFYHTLKNAEYIEETEYLAFTLQKYNMGPGNMWKVLGYDGHWMDNRDMISAGDKYYFEHVLSRLDNGTIIKLRLVDGSYYITEITNLSLEKHISRS